jgi:hypothetical protein
MRKKKDMAGEVAEFIFHAAVYKVMTLVDGGIRVTLDMPETEIATAAIFMECQRQGIPLILEAKADNA